MADTGVTPDGKVCGLCGHVMTMEECGSASVDSAGTHIDLCHAADHDCYKRWTIDCERPEGTDPVPVVERLARLLCHIDQLDMPATWTEESLEQTGAADDFRRAADLVLSSDVIAAHDRSVAARALEEAAAAMMLPGSGAHGYYAGEHQSGYNEAEQHAIDWLKARALSVRSPEETNNALG